MENTEKSRLKAGKAAGIVGICANILLFAVKVLIGIISGSISVVADAINNLSDAGSSVFVLVGYHLSGKPADREHPYGHARMEYLCGLFISVIITVLGIELARDSLSKLFSGGSGASFDLIAIVVMAVTMAGKAALAVYYGIVAKKIGSDVLRASAIDSIGDIFATGAVVAGMLLTPVTGPLTDAVLGALIALYIIILGIKLIKESSDTLIGKAPDRELVDDIVKKIRSYDGVLGIHDLVIHSYGAGRVFASVHVEVDAMGDIMVSHDLCDNIENDFRSEGIVELVIHMDPVQHSDPAVCALKGQVADIIGHISAEQGSPVSMHDFRVVFGVTHSNLIFDVAVTDEFPISDRELCLAIESEVKKLDPTYNTVITVDRDYTTNRFGNVVN
ncbi:MAG: cation transporter [Clostridia bacterium]|nr:cation transporter [Clostridia bacterium]